MSLGQLLWLWLVAAAALIAAIVLLYRPRPRIVSLVPLFEEQMDLAQDFGLLFSIDPNPTTLYLTVAIDPETCDPNDLTKGDGTFTITDRYGIVPQPGWMEEG